MKTVFSPKQLAHRPRSELSDGRFIDAVEIPARADALLAGVQAAGFGPVIEPQAFPEEAITRVHTPDYVTFLKGFWDKWLAAGRAGEAFPFAWPVRGLRHDKVPTHVDGLLGRYSFDAGTPFTEGAWTAARAGVDVALTAAALVEAGEREAFALCRPPGHHAASDYFGGYCFLNNAAIAAQWFLDQGAERVAVLDIDYHHGNGTQTIFEARSDVFFLSLHSDPVEQYPYFLGYADEIGIGEGAGYTANYPMQKGTGIDNFLGALDDALAKVKAYAPSRLVVSLGLDTFDGDPIADFCLKTGDYAAVGARVAGLGLPCLYVMEGGYAVDALGANIASFFNGVLRR